MTAIREISATRKLMASRKSGDNISIHANNRFNMPFLSLVSIMLKITSRSRAENELTNRNQKQQICVGVAYLHYRFKFQKLRTLNVPTDKNLGN